MIKVKRLIALLNGEDLTPQTALEATVKTLVAKIGGILPAVSAADNGSVLGVVNGAWAKDSHVFVAAGALTKDEHEKNVLTLNKTPEELHAAVAAGKQLKIAITVGEFLMEASAAVSAAKISEGGSTMYEFYFVNHEGMAFHSSTPGGTDAVTFTEV